jgi:hypothetical protein
MPAVCSWQVNMEDFVPALGEGLLGLVKQGVRSYHPRKVEVGNNALVAVTAGRSIVTTSITICNLVSSIAQSRYSVDYGIPG